MDIIQRQLAEDLVSALRQVSGISLRFPPDAGWEHLDIRMGVGGHPALVADRPKNKLVRRALAYGIDRVAIVRELLADIEGTPRPLDSVVLEAVIAPTGRTGAATATARTRRGDSSCSRVAAGVLTACTCVRGVASPFTSCLAGAQSAACGRLS